MLIYQSKLHLPTLVIRIDGMRKGYGVGAVIADTIPAHEIRAEKNIVGRAAANVDGECNGLPPTEVSKRAPSAGIIDDHRTIDSKIDVLRRTLDEEPGTFAGH